MINAQQAREILKGTRIPFSNMRGLRIEMENAVRMTAESHGDSVFFIALPHWDKLTEIEQEMVKVELRERGYKVFDTHFTWL